VAVGGSVVGGGVVFFGGDIVDVDYIDLCPCSQD
jgi:hypothetical protein